MYKCHKDYTGKTTIYTGAWNICINFQVISQLLAHIISHHWIHINACNVTPYIENLTTITILATIQNFVDTNNILKFVVVKVYSWLMSCHITGFILMHVTPYIENLTYITILYVRFSI